MNQDLPAVPSKAELPYKKMGRQHPLRILVAEDNMVNQKVLLAMLGRLGYQADVAGDGTEVLEAFQRQSYDVILMDAQMPELNGEQATMEIRKRRPKAEQPRIIAVTANVRKGEKEHYLDAGMDDYIAKPVRIEDLVRVLSQSQATGDPNSGLNTRSRCRMDEPAAETERISSPVPGVGGVNCLERQKKVWQKQWFMTQALHAVPESIFVLNLNRQTVFANEAFLSHLGINDDGKHCDRRWGEILGCQHAFQKGGCGKVRFCKTCGGLKAIETGRQGARNVRECRILTRTGDALDLQVTVVPVDYEEDRYLICTITDISDQKRRSILERLFFHDVTNTSIGIRSLIDTLTESAGEQAVDVQKILVKTAATLVEQIQTQRLLTMAENKNLPVSVKPIDSLEFLRDIFAKWKEEARGRHLDLVIEADSTSVEFSSDDIILAHVLNSTVKNAFDASLRGMKIVLGCYAEAQAVVFRVQNSAVMTEDVQLQVFQRSFSTRGSGRGLGTYSMKFLTEQYLGGKIDFNSEESGGTVFYIRLPLILPETMQGK